MKHTSKSQGRSSKKTSTDAKRRHSNWGGARPGAGRKKSTNEDQGPPHTKRAAFDVLTVHHVTLKLDSGLPRIQSKRVAAAITALFAEAVAEDRFAPTHWSIQSNQIHLIVEAHSSVELAKGMQSLGVRIAKNLNQLWNRKGKVFLHRYFAHPVTSPGQIRKLKNLHKMLPNRKQRPARATPATRRAPGRGPKSGRTGSSRRPARGR